MNRQKQHSYRNPRVCGPHWSRCVRLALLPVGVLWVAGGVQPGHVVAATADSAIVRVEVHPGVENASRDNGGGAASEAVVGDLVYSNTGATLTFPPGANRLIADDLRTISTCGCTLEHYEVRVGGGGDGTGAAFSVNYAMYDACPGEGGVLIPGTEGTASFPDDNVYTLSITPTAVVAVPRSLWIGLEFSRNGAGWLVGSSADPGFGLTTDLYYHPNIGCDAVFTGLFAGYWAKVFCDPTAGPGPAANPNPADGAVDVDPATILDWSGPGALQAPSDAFTPLPVADSAVAEAGGDTPAAPNGWAGQLVPGTTCGTQEHWEAKQGGGETGSVAGGCGQLGICDDPAVRDAFIPAPTTPQNVYRLHVHVFCQDNGSACTSTVTEVNNQINTLNSNYAPWRISFEHDLSFHNDSTYWSWASNEEVGMKSTYAVDPASKLNIFLVNVEGQFSFGTFPWDPDALTVMGGVVMNNGQWSSTATTIAHEIGHNLGLWHTHHGVSEVSQCGACWESPNAPDSTVGDRCADTDPTPTNFNCSPPGGSDACGGGPWGTTDFHNYMSYSDCRTEFTPQQAGRVHCWTDDVVSSWLLPQCTATYDVFLGTTNPPTTAVCTGVAEPFCDPGFLNCATTYFWQVAVTSDITGNTTAGPVWSFATPTGPDCNANGTADACDIGTGASGDCNANSVPDECEADCQSNGVADACDIDQGTSADCDANGVPDECDPDADLDGVPNACDICPGGNDTLDADADGVPDFCDVCAGGDDTVDFDFDGVPDFCDACPLDNPDDPDADGICTSNDNCALSNPLQLDCQSNGIGDVCDLDAGTSNDDNANGIPDECEIATPQAPDELGVACTDDAGCTNLAVCLNNVCYVPKNRYVSIGINPANAGRDTARRVSLDPGGSPLVLGWVGPPDANSICHFQADPYYADWSLAGPVSLGDCAIAPSRTYLIQAIPAGMDIGIEANYSVALALPTTAVWGDVGGSVAKGLLQPPDGTANFSDIQAIVTEFQGGGQAPRVRLDLDGQTPDYEVGFGDIQRAVFGFQDVAYSFSDPCSCVGLAPCP